MNSSNNSLLTVILVQVFSPFTGFLFSFKKTFKKHSSLNYILLGGFYGLVYVPILDSDMTRYLQEFQDISSWNSKRLFNEIKSGGFSDYYTAILSFLVSIFTDKPEIFLAVATSIYSYFYFNSIRLILNLFKLDNSKFSNALIFIFYFYAPIFFVNSLRFYTAFFVFFYGIIHIVFLKNRNFYALLILTPLIHLAFSIVVTVFLLYSVIGKSRIISYLFLFFSFFTSFTNVEVSFFAGDSISQQKILDYTESERVYRINEAQNDVFLESNQKFKFFKVFSDYHYYFILSFLFIIIISRKRLLLVFDNYDHKIINLNIFMLAIVLLTESIPESYRFKHIFSYFFFISLLVVFNNLLKLKLFRNLFIFLLIAILPYIIMVNYIGLKTLSFDFFFSNWIIVYLSL
jgi:hypothetical protein